MTKDLTIRHLSYAEKNGRFWSVALDGIKYDECRIVFGAGFKQSMTKSIFTQSAFLSFRQPHPPPMKTTATNRMKTKQSMKIGNLITKLIVCISLFSASAAMAVSTYLWTGGAGTTNLLTGANWSPAPSSFNNAGDIFIFTNNVTSYGTLAVISGGNWGPTSSSTTPGGAVVYYEGTNNLTIQAPDNSSRWNMGNLSISNGAGIFTMGAASGITVCGFRESAMTFLNNSTNPATIKSTCNFFNGGGIGNRNITFSGTGDWVAEGAIISSAASPNGFGGSEATASITKNGSGKLSLNGLNNMGSNPIQNNSAVILNAGTLSLGNANAMGSGTGALTITGGSLDSSVANLVIANNNPENWNGDFTFIGTQNLNIGSGAVTLNANRIVTISANTLEVDGVVGGAFSLTKSGAGTLYLNHANAYSGGTTISNGIVKLGVSGALTNAGNVTVYGTLDLNGNSVTSLNLSGTGIVDTVSGGTPTLTVSNTSSTTFSGVIKNTSGTLALTKGGSSTLTLAGANTYTGNTAVNAGTLLVNGSIGAGAVTVASGATLGGTNTIGGNVNWQSGSAALFTVTPTTASGSNATPLIVSGNVTLNANTMTVNVPGATPLAAGTYKLMTYNTSGSSGAFSVGAPTFTGAGVGSGTASSISTSGGAVTLTVVFTGLSATWTNNGSGNWSTVTDWSSNPSYPHVAGDSATLGVGSAYTTATVDTAVSLAALAFTNANSFLVADSGNALTFTNPFGGALINVTAGSSNAIAAAVILGTNLTTSVASGTSLTFTNIISNSGGAKTLTVSGAGTTVLSATNTYGPSAGGVGTTFGGGILKLGNNNSLGAGDVSMSGSGTIQAGAALTLSNNIIDGSGTTTLDNNGNNVTLAGVISGAGAFAKSSAGTLSLNSSNSYAGNTTLNAGTVVLNNAYGIPGGTNYGNVTLNSNAVLNLNGNNVVLNGLGSSTNTAIVDTLSGGSVTLTVGESGASATFLGSISNSSGSLTLVKDGNGVETLAGVNGYTGGTTINAGTLQLGNGGISGNLGSGALLDNGLLGFNLTGAKIFTNDINGSGGVLLNNASLSLWLTGNNGFTGGITNFGGALWVSNSTTGLGVGPKTVLCASPNATIHLDGSLGGLSLDSSIALYLSGSAGVLFNEAGNNTVSGIVGMVNGNGNPYIVVNSGTLTLAGGVSTVAGNNPRTLVLGGVGNGLISGKVTEAAPGSPQASLTKQDAGTWTLSYAGNDYSGVTTVSGGTLIIDAAGSYSGSGAIVVTNSGTLNFNGTDNGNGVITVNNGGILNFNGTDSGNGTITVNSGGTLNFNGNDYGTGGVTVATNGICGGVGTIFSTPSGPTLAYQLGAKGAFTTSAGGSTPLTVYGNVTLNNNSLTVFVDGGTPLSPGTYTLLSEGNPGTYSISGAFSSAATIAGAGIVSGSRAAVVSSSSQVSLVVSLNSTWTNNANGNWTTGANWDSNPTYPNAAAQVATLGVGSSLITVNLDASETVGGVAFTNANSFAVTNAANVLTLDNNGNGASISVAAGTANSIATGVSLNDATAVSTVAGTALAISGSINGGSALTATGNGVLTLSGANSYSGTTTLGGGTLVLGSTTAIGSGTLTISGGTLDSSVANLVNANNNAQNWNGSFGFAGSQSLNLGSGAVTLGNNLTVTVNTNKLIVGGAISGAYTLTLGGTNNGTLELDAANGFTGLTIVSGTVALGDDNALGTATQIQLSPAAITPAATNLTIMSKDSTAHTITNGFSANGFDGPYILGGAGNLNFSGTIATGNGQKRFTVNNTTTFSGFVTDNGAPSGPIIKDGSGTLVISGSNTLTKQFTLNAGTLALGSTNAIGSGALTISGGGLDSTVANLTNANNNAQTWGGNFYFAGSQNLNLGTGSVTMSANRTITVSNNTFTVGGAISGAGALTKAGAGKLVLAGANTLTNNTTVSAGTLEIVQATLATNSTVSISNSAVLKLDFAVTNKVGALVLNGVTQSGGVYGSSTPGGYITGTGYLQVAQTGPSGPASITSSVTGGGSTLSLAWPSGQGWRLQMQTNSLATGLGTNWIYITDGSLSSTNITIDANKPTVFYRLTYP